MKDDDSMLARFRSMRKKGGEKDDVDAADAAPGSKKEPTFGDLKAAADRIDELAGPMPGGEGGPPVDGAAPPTDPGAAASGDDASVLAESAGVSPEEARKLLDAAKRLPEVADLDAKALGERLREDFDLRMRLEELAARPARIESAGPKPIGSMGMGMGGPPGGEPMGGM